MSKPEQGASGSGRVVVGLIIVALIGGGIYLLRDQLFPKKSGEAGPVNPGSLAPSSEGVEKTDLKGITTVQEYSYVPSERLPKVEGVKGYQWSATDRVVEFPINVWIGWLPIIAANHGAEPNTDSLFYKRYGFKVRLSLIDNPVQARTAFVTGKSHILWGTLDMMVLFAEGLMKDSRTSPRIFQQIDWSSGGDGIVVRGDINEVRDLKGKTIALAQNSPSEYYLFNLLIRSGLQPGDVKTKFTADAFQAAAAFASNADVDACVSWAPDIYTISEKVKGTKLLSTTAEANRVIADVWAARADFAKDHPEVIQGLVSGIFDGIGWLKQSDANKKQAYAWLGKLYSFPAEDVAKMANDAYSTNFGENAKFFLNQNNPTNFENTWKSVSYVYKTLGLIDNETPFDRVMDFSVIKTLRDQKKYVDQSETAATSFVPRSYEQVAEGKTPVLRQAIRIHFYPNSENLHESAHDPTGKAVAGQLYDPNVDKLIASAAQLAGQFETCTIAVTGHCDSSNKGQVDYRLAQELSQKRAQAVRDALVKRGKFNPNKFAVKGKAWDEAADPQDPENQALNRRVEIVVYPPEAPQ
ncbi:MAG: OmpA family protein [Armatimonadetes bacterium]|nr:OmpA family protein [Armatimonadota bacterium]